MPLEPFNNSASLSLGVELELQLIGLSDFDLSGTSPDMLALLQRQPFPGHVMPEITKSMIEIGTNIHMNYKTLLDQLLDIRDKLVMAGDRLNIGICGGGTHSFQDWSKQCIFSKPRFKETSMLYGYLAKQFTIFGQHIHIGCVDGDQALFLLHALNRYIPHFIALSASSPFVHGKDTLFDSSRLNSVFAFPLSGRAPFTLSWTDFSENYFAKMEHTGVVKSMKDFYWDIRPKPEFGTIELRVCDTPLSVQRAAVLAGYMQTLCQYLLTGHEPSPVEDDYLVYTYNRFQACRFGLEGNIVHPKTYEQVSLREDILMTLGRLEEHAQSLDSTVAITGIHQIMDCNGDASYLREEYIRRGSVEGVVEASLEQFRRTESL